MAGYDGSGANGYAEQPTTRYPGQGGYGGPPTAGYTGQNWTGYTGQQPGGYPADPSGFGEQGGYGEQGGFPGPSGFGGPNGFGGQGGFAEPNGFGGRGGFAGEQPDSYPGAQQAAYHQSPQVSPAMPGGRFGGPQPGFADQPAGYSGPPAGGYSGFQQSPDAGPRFGPGGDFGLPVGASQAGRPTAPRAGMSPGRHKLLIGGAGAVAVVAVAAVIMASKWFGPSDPGCKAYAGPTLTAYNQTISDLNAQAPEATLNADMSAAIANLTSAVSQAQDAKAKAALSGLLSELKTVRADIQAGSVPLATVTKLNAASTAADRAC